MGITFSILFGLCIWLVMMVVVSHILSRVSGWHALAEVYRQDEPFQGRVWRFQRGQFRYLMSYKNCVTVGADSNGLYIALLFLFRIAHPPLFIPWREISVSRGKVLWVKTVNFKLGRELQIPFIVRETLGEKIRLEAGSSWPQEEHAAHTLVLRPER